VSKFKVSVIVSLRPSVLDPAGEATASASKRLGIEGISNLRIGKSIQLDIEAKSEHDARTKIEVLCDRLLSNPVMENWSFDLRESNS
tara:strand:- start:500 stop:760 length:261 start_codon:yes stop_codon:yes gene_type:complete